MEYLSGFESTYVFGTGKDVLDTTGHTEKFRADLALAAASGLKTLRYSVPWHKIEAVEGQYDWTWIDEAIDYADQTGLDLIVDPLHHTSFPEWLTYGFADDRFVASYTKFVLAFAERAPWVTKFTYINEPLVTSWFCGHEDVWYPWMKDDAAFYRMVFNCARAICVLDTELRKTRKVEYYHVEACERHFADTPKQARVVDENNRRRFVIHDLITGKMKMGNPMYVWMQQHGFTQQDERWFMTNTAKIDVLGLDWYNHCEIWWGEQGRIEPRTRVGFAQVAKDYTNRYPGADGMLSETNIRGTPAERLAHFRMMQQECKALAYELTGMNQSFRGFCWYPFIDSCDWDSLVTRADGHIDPQGVVSLNENRDRVETEFSRAFAEAARHP